MERYLKKGQSICLNNNEYKVKNIIGKGSSCIVYHTIASDNTEHLLKEYNPCDIELYRDSNGFLEVDNEEEQDEYSVGLKRFENGGKLQRKLRLSNELKNSTCNVQGVYNAYGTAYIDMTCFSGMTYEKRNNESLYTILKRAKALTEVVGNYHNAGFLHLDIKPENIFTLEETEEFVMLFDFDSIIEKSNLSDKPTLSYTKSWAAPEQLLIGRQGKICEATDIFAIGEIIFYKLFGRHSTTEEKRSFSNYVYDFESIGLKDVNPRVKLLLDNLFHHTICTNVKKRYQSTEELIAALDELIEMARPEKSYIKTSLPKPEDKFFGRDREIVEIGEELNKEGILFLSGVGGIGKSELAKQFAKTQLINGRYDTVIFMPFVADVMSMIIDDEKVSVYNFYKYPAEEIQNYYNRKMRKLKELCDEKTLIIIDNFDVEDINNIDAEFKKITELNCNILITTRFDFTELGYAQYYLDKIDDECDILNIFFEYYKTSISDEELKIVKEIISIVDGHTLAVELLAKQMQAGRVKPDAMLKKLKEGGIEQSGKESVISDKDGDISRQNTYSHIKTLFDISDLNDSERYILANLSLIPHTGISTELFHDWCELESYDVINSLCREGWVRMDREKDYISLHSVIGQICNNIVSTNNEIIDILINACLLEIDRNKISNLPYAERTKKHIIWENMAHKVFSMRVFLKSVASFLASDFWVSYIPNEDNYYEIVKEFYEYAFTIRKELCSKISDDYVESLINIATLYITLNDYSNAEKYCTEALEIQSTLDDSNHKILGKIFENLGFLYTDLFKFEEGESFLIKAINEFEKIDNTYEKNNFLSNAYTDLAQLYEESNQLDKAEENYIQGMKKLYLISSFEHPNLALLFNYLGLHYCRTSKWNEAEDCLKKSLSMNLALYGMESGEVAFSYKTLGNYYIKRHINLNEAESYLLQGFEIVKRIYGVASIPSSSFCNDLAAYYFEVQCYESAEKYYILALNYRKSVIGDSHPLMATLYTNIGALYTEQNRFVEAEKALEKALEIYLPLDEMKSGIDRTYYWKGMLNYKIGNNSAANIYAQKSYEICRHIYSENHSHTSLSYELLLKTQEKYI